MKKIFFASGLLIASFMVTQIVNGQALQLPTGFASTIVAEGLGGARHLAVTKQGNVYVKLSRLKDRKGIIYLRDMKNGKFNQQLAFGDYPGTGIFIKGNYLYASSNEDVYRYKL